MTEIRVKATNHTSFTVSDIDKTIAFFRDCLGFDVTSKAPRSKQAIQAITGVEGADVMIAYVRGPGHNLELIEYLGPETRTQVLPRPCDVGFAHVAYDVDDVDAAVHAAARYGLRPAGDIYPIDQGPNAGGRVVYLRDADGITIELIEKPSG